MKGAGPLSLQLPMYRRAALFKKSHLWAKEKGAAMAAPFFFTESAALLNVARFEVRFEEVELLFCLHHELLEEVGGRLIPDFIDLV